MSGYEITSWSRGQHWHTDRWPFRLAQQIVAADRVRFASAAAELSRWAASFEVKLMEFPPELAKEIQARLDEFRARYPSTDRKAVMVDGSIGYGCYVSPDGDVYMETYDIGSDAPSVIDRSRQAQIQVLILGSRAMPKLAELLPQRQPDVPACGNCDGSGRVLQGLTAFGKDWEGLLCGECNGLGWVELS